MKLVCVKSTESSKVEGQFLNKFQALTIDPFGCESKRYFYRWGDKNLKDKTFDIDMNQFKLVNRQADIVDADTGEVITVNLTYLVLPHEVRSQQQ